MIQLYDFEFFIQLKNENTTSGYIYWLNRNLRSQARDALAIFLNNFSISDMDSIRAQLGMLSKLTSQTDEISRKSEVNSKDKLTRKKSILRVARPFICE